jgi:uncharacterized protein YcbX
VPRVARLNVAPVKSLGLHHPDELWLDRAGAAHDRRFFLVDEAGRMVRGASFGPLVRVRPAYDADADALTLAFPDGTVVGGPVERGEEITASFFGKRPVPGRIVGNGYAAALSAYAGRPLRLVEATFEGTGTDSAIPVSLVSRASVEEIEPGLDARRFRMLVELEGARPREEDDWPGRVLRVGDALVRAGTEVARCANTTYDPDTGVRDFDTLRAIAETRGRREDGEICLGVYGEVAQPGRVRVGDTVELAY